MNGLVASSAPIVVGTVASPAARKASTSASAPRSPHCPARRPAHSARSTGYIRARNRPASRGAARPAAACWRTSARRSPRTAARTPSRTACRRRTPRVLGEMIDDMPRGVRGHRHHLRDMAAERRRVALAHRPVERRDARGLGGGGDHLAPGRGLDRRVAAGVIGMPMRVPDRGDRPAAPVRLGEHRIGERRIDHDRLGALGIVDEPDVIVAQRGDADDLETGHHHSPVLGIDAQGSATGRLAPFCSSSIEIWSGVRRMPSGLRAAAG